MSEWLGSSRCCLQASDCVFNNNRPPCAECFSVDLVRSLGLQLCLLHCSCQEMADAPPSSAPLPDWPTIMLGKQPPLPGLWAPVLGTLITAPGVSHGDFHAQPRPPPPDYTDPRAWGSFPPDASKKSATDVSPDSVKRE